MSERQRESGVQPGANRARPAKDAAAASEVSRLTSLVDRLRREADVLRSKLEQSATPEGQRGDESDSAAARPASEQSRPLAPNDPLTEHLVDLQKLEGLGVLARIIAHDFNNQLTVILGNSSLAQADLEPGSGLHQRLDRVRHAAQSAARLTEQLLSHSGATAGPVKSIHLPHLLEAMRELLELAAGKRCELSLEVPPELPLIEADETQIRQLILALTSNAAEAHDCDTGHCWLRVRVEAAGRGALHHPTSGAELPAADYLVLEVEDDGAGIPEGDRERIFEPFFTTRLPGRGLGLAAVRQIVQSHDGAITLESVPGQGTTVRVMLPTAQSRSLKSG